MTKIARFQQSHILVIGLWYNYCTSGGHYNTLEAIAMDDIKKDWLLTIFDALTYEDRLLLLERAEEFLHNQEDDHDPLRLEH